MRILFVLNELIVFKPCKVYGVGRRRGIHITCRLCYRLYIGIAAEPVGDLCHDRLKLLNGLCLIESLFDLRGIIVDRFDGSLQIIYRLRVFRDSEIILFEAQTEGHKGLGIGVLSLAVGPDILGHTFFGVSHEHVAGLVDVHHVVLIESVKQTVIVKLIVDALNTVLQNIAQIGVGVKVCDDLHASLQASGVGGNTEHAAEDIVVSGAGRFNNIHVILIAVGLDQFSAALDDAHRVFLSGVGVGGDVVEILVFADGKKLLCKFGRVRTVGFVAEHTREAEHGAERRAVVYAVTDDVELVVINGKGVGVDAPVLCKSYRHITDDGKNVGLVLLDICKEVFAIDDVCEIGRGVFNLDKEKFRIFKPTPCPIDKIQNRYRWRIIIKGIMDNKTNKILNEVLREIYTKNIKDTRISIDINPNSMS